MGWKVNMKGWNENIKRRKGWDINRKGMKKCKQEKKDGM